MSFVGRKNAYVCHVCGGKTVTIDRDDGVTPFMIRCRATKDCEAMAESSFYRCDPTLVPTHEWYRPGAAEIGAATPAMRQHYEMGGLGLREIGI